MNYLLVLTLLGLTRSSLSDQNSDQIIFDLTSEVRLLSRSMLGMSKVVFDLSSKVKSIQGGLNEINHAKSNLGREDLSGKVEDEKKREVLATKVEKMLAVRGVDEVERAKSDIERKLQLNFVKMLSSLIIANPEPLKTQSENIFKLMGATLNGDLDFNPLVQNLPNLLRTDQTNQFVLIGDALRNSDNYPANARVLGGLQNMNQILDIFSTIDIKEVSMFLTEIPMLFEAVDGLVDGVEEYF